MTIFNLTRITIPNLIRMKIELFVISVAPSIQVMVNFGLVAMTDSTLNVKTSSVKSIFKMSICVKNVECKSF